MAKREGVNKSAAVRAYYEQETAKGRSVDEIKPKEVIEALAKKVAVTTGLVSNVKNGLKQEAAGGTATKTRKPGPKAGAKSSGKSASNGSVTLADAQRVHELAQEFGGTAKLREILDAVESFSN